MGAIQAQEIYAEIQARFEAALEAGTVPWQQPWVGELSAPRNLQSGKAYRGINALLLGLSGYSDPRWTTFNAARKMQGKVRKGERSTLVTLWKRIKVKDSDAPNGEKIIAILRYFRVFNVKQIDWPEGAIQPLKELEPPEDWNPIEEAESVLVDFLASPNAPTLDYRGNVACYIPRDHAMLLPRAESFRSAHGFYGTAFHECAHSTSHKSMLNRELSTRFGSESYAQEELVAEMTAAFVCAAIGVDGGFDNSTAYIKGWLRAIRDDEKLIVRAAGKAQKAADRILGNMLYEPETTTEKEAIHDV